MYNRYIGNTGKFTRVEDQFGSGRRQAQRAAPPPAHRPDGPAQDAPVPRPPNLPAQGAPVKNKPLFGGPGGGFGGLLGGRGSGGLLGGLGSGLKGLTGIFDHLPFGLDLGDILLFLLLFFFFIESGDEEFIIILAVIAFSILKER